MTRFIEAHKKDAQPAVVFHNGVFGMFEDPRFEEGTRSFVAELKRMKDAGIKVYIGGGEGGRHWRSTADRRHLRLHRRRHGAERPGQRAGALPRRPGHGREEEGLRIGVGEEGRGWFSNQKPVNRSWCAWCPRRGCFHAGSGS